jgi:hypothetical protein
MRVVPEPLHETPPTALVVRLEAPGRIEGRLVAVDGTPLSGAKVDARVDEGWHEFDEGNSMATIGMPPLERFSTTTDANGRFVLEELPPWTSLWPEVTPEKRSLPWRPGRIVLGAGEVRRVEWVVDDGCRLIGRLVDPEGLPLAYETIRLEPARNGRPTYFPIEQSDWMQTTTTGLGGTFAFDRVAPGAWWLGPAAGRSTRYEGATKTVSAPAVAPVGVVINIAAGQKTVEAGLRGDVGLEISGTVVDPEGHPIPRSQSFARRRTSPERSPR